jgi:hypothetical protein
MNPHNLRRDLAILRDLMQRASDIARTLVDPIAGAIRASIREVGRRLCAAGGLDAMQAAWRVLAADPGVPGWFLSRIDGACLGINTDGRGTWVC